MKTEELNELHSQLVAEQEKMLADFKKLKDEYKKKANDVFKKLSKGVFEVCPQIKTIWWTQYIPSWNDGDPCTFTMGDLYVSNASQIELEDDNGLNEDSFYEDDNLFVDSTMEDEWYEKWSADKNNTWHDKYFRLVSKEQNKVLNMLSVFIHKNEDMMQDLFGDDVQIIITRDGVTSEEYDCGY